MNRTSPDALAARSRFYEWQLTDFGRCPACGGPATWASDADEPVCNGDNRCPAALFFAALDQRHVEYEPTQNEIDRVRHGVLTPFTEIKAEPVRWLWRDRIALGKLTALAGRPKAGKGLLYSRLIAEMTTGTLHGDLPSYLRGPRAAIIVTSEDAPGDTLKPRLMAAGADLSRVYTFKMTGGDGAPFRVPQDAEALRDRIAQKDAALIVVDPLIEFLDGKIDAHKSAQVRQSVASLTAVADECDCAILVVLHLNKGSSSDALLRHEGSAAFTQIIRGAMLLAPDPDDPEGESGSRRILAPTSSNLGKLAPSLSYEIRGQSVKELGSAELIETAAIHLLGGSSASSRDLLSEARESRSDDRSALDDAIEFLLEELAAGPQASEAVQTSARRAGISLATLRRAKGPAGVKSRKSSGSGPWVWYLPAANPKVLKHDEHLGTSDDEHVAQSPLFTGRSTDSKHQDTQPETENTLVNERGRS